jgi:predicted ATPase
MTSGPSKETGMKIHRIEIQYFKSHLKAEFEPGNVNVFIGANGAGKTSLIEAIGLLSSVFQGRVDSQSLRERGVRLGIPAIYKTALKSQERLSNMIHLELDWEHEGSKWEYTVSLNNPIDKPEPFWTYYTESLRRSGNDEPVFSYGPRTGRKYKDFNMQPDISALSVAAGDASLPQLGESRRIFTEYSIFSPSASVLQGIQGDGMQKNPIGLSGGRLTESVDELLRKEEGKFGDIDIEDLYDLIDWASGINTGFPSKEILSPDIPAPKTIIRFTDRFMSSNRNTISAYDASEGALYVLFMLSLLMHEKAPLVFAVDNFDQALNPRLVKRLTSLVCELAIQRGKTVFLTSHNPLVLDGLDIKNDKIRLFTVDRKLDGTSEINRIKVGDAINLSNDSLSRLWLGGRLGGMPNL